MYFNILTLHKLDNFPKYVPTFIVHKYIFYGNTVSGNFTLHQKA